MRPDVSAKFTDGRSRSATRPRADAKHIPREFESSGRAIGQFAVSVPSSGPARGDEADTRACPECGAVPAAVDETTCPKDDRWYVSASARAKLDVAPLLAVTAPEDSGRSPPRRDADSPR